MTPTRPQASKSSSFSGKLNWIRVKVGIEVAPEALLDNKVRVFRDTGQKFHQGVVIDFNTNAWTHTIKYDAGEQREEMLVLYRVMVPKNPQGAQGPCTSSTHFWPEPTIIQLQGFSDILLKKACEVDPSMAAGTSRSRLVSGNNRATTLWKSAQSVLDRIDQRDPSRFQHCSPSTRGQEKKRKSADTQATFQQPVGLRSPAAQKINDVVGNPEMLQPEIQKNQVVAACPSAVLEPSSCSPPNPDDQATTNTTEQGVHGRDESSPVLHRLRSHSLPPLQPSSKALRGIHPTSHLPSVESHGKGRPGRGRPPNDLHPECQRALKEVKSKRHETASVTEIIAVHKTYQNKVVNGRDTELTLPTTEDLVVDNEGMDMKKNSRRKLSKRQRLSVQRGQCHEVTKGTLSCANAVAEDRHDPNCMEAEAPAQDSPHVDADCMENAPSAPRLECDIAACLERACDFEVINQQEASCMEVEVDENKLDLALALEQVGGHDAACSKEPCEPAASEQNKAGMGPDTTDHADGQQKEPQNRRKRSQSLPPSFSNKLQYTEVDVAVEYEPLCLMGLPIQVYWPLDRTFYPGRIVAFDPASYKHRVLYDDGEVEERVLAIDRVMLGLTTCTGVRRGSVYASVKPSALQLEAAGHAVGREAESQQQSGAPVRQVHVLLRRSEFLLSKAQDLRSIESLHAEDDAGDMLPALLPHSSLPAHPSSCKLTCQSEGCETEKNQQEEAEAPQPTCCRRAPVKGPHRRRTAGPIGRKVWRGAGTSGGGQIMVLEPGVEQEQVAERLLSCWGHFQGTKAQYLQFREYDLAYYLSPELLVGRLVRILWPEDNAWFLGKVTKHDSMSGLHKVEYVDGDHEMLLLAAEEVRLLVSAGEQLPLASTSTLEANMKLLQAAGQQLMSSFEAMRVQDPGEYKKAGHMLRKAQELSNHLEFLKQHSFEEKAPEASVDVALTEQQGKGKVPTDAGLALTEVQQGEEHSSLPPHTSSSHAAVHDVHVVIVHPLPSISTGATADEGLESQKTQSLVTDTLDMMAETHAGHDMMTQPHTGPAMPGDGACPLVHGDGRLDSHTKMLNGTPHVDVLRPSEAIVLAPGDMAWAVVKGHTPWPCVVITQEEAVRKGVQAGGNSKKASNRVNVTFFGDFASAAVHNTCVMSIPVAVSRGLHAPRVGSSKQAALFRQALMEAAAYMKEGELPPRMVPDNNDNPFAQDSDADESGEEADLSLDVARAGRRAGQSALPFNLGTYEELQDAIDHGLLNSSRSLSLPVQISKTLTLLCLGEVEWINPFFQNERFIFPVGYKVSRLANTPASSKRSVPHIMEICRSPDGLKPVFRITPDGCPPVEGPSPSAAFSMLWDCDANGRGKSLQLSGPAAFGFMHERIIRLIQSLPGAGRCERYCGWPRGRGLTGVPGLTREETLAREVALAADQQLPPGIVPQTAPLDIHWECQVCGEDTECEGSYMLHCDMCRMCVHMDCIGVETEPDGGLWLCDICTLMSAGLKNPPACVLCPFIGGGPMKRTTEGKWCHLMCTMWVPEVGFVDPDKREPIEGVEKVTAARKKLLCTFCRQPYGACIQCAGGKSCYTAFHPLCARNAGLSMVMEAFDGDVDDEEEEEGAGVKAVTTVNAEEVETRQPEFLSETIMCGQESLLSTTTQGLTAGPLPEDQATGRDPSVGHDGLRVCLRGESERSLLKTSTSNPGAEVAVDMCEVSSPPREGCRVVKKGSLKGSRSRSQQVMAEGTRAGNHRLLCYCHRHRTLAMGDGSREDINRDSGCVPGQRRRIYTLLQEMAEHTTSASAAAAVPSGQQEVEQSCGLQGDQTCSSVGIVPDTISHSLGSARCIPLLSCRSRGLREPEHIARAEAKRLYVKRNPYLVTGCLRRQPLPLPQLMYRDPTTMHLGLQPTILSTSSNPDDDPTHMPGHRECNAEPAAYDPKWLATSSRAMTSHQSTEHEHGAVCDTKIAPGRPESMAERYHRMKASGRLRITCGKSAIHGLGAMAKADHRAGDMVIEYVGDLIRPSVAEMREHALYNSMVGVGTYVFRLGEDSCVDATRAGNMAHLLNHSCQPNCYSRTITVRDVQSNRLDDHVIIFAKRDIVAGEELTYDYRFNGKEKLPCNCGTASCRGFVNVPEDMFPSSFEVPRGMIQAVRITKDLPR
ncbi:hypothetical protein CEUSTIGMA_g9374.t1 [Chlamydomonas eustigma]|uniref:Histone-lysine N-methyltransferase n=1 Tax=Chlamydomonas eustigma TaxID=1157962 RepID=A0A250XFY8_9CHLO|nr:hypothetical protein CEUSTIGMA_g9374.t1 [Chlamydomonas eustigma]|eukprot:GAX81946.1 hypothetical protein CEUSTIGMA_g9374.t1 [Chlamydomonas eustigma]